MLRLPTFVRSLAATLACAGFPFAVSAGPYSEAFFFGDSLSDSGNVAIAIGADPGQVITGNTYIPGQPYASGQFSNGDVWVKTFAAAIGIAPSGLPSLAGGGDYAFGGARVATDGPGLPPSLAAQEASFLADHGGSAPASALYVIAGGGNDARDTFAAAAGALDPTGIIAAAALAYAQATGALVDQLQAAGAQHIVVWDVPNLGVSPAVIALPFPGATTLATLISQAMNVALAARLAIEPGVKIFDIFGLQNQIVANPASFGLANVTDACGAIVGCDPSTYLYWDGIHPTSAGHAILAQGMLVVAVPEPAEIALMLGGLALVAARTARLRRRGSAREVAP